MTVFAEFGAATNFSFLRGASHPEEMVAMAQALGLSGLGIADRNSVAGVVRAYAYAKERLAEAKDFRVVSGARLVFADGTPDILAYPRDREAWGRLTRLLTVGNARSEKGSCTLFAGDLARFCDGMQLILAEESTYEPPEGPGLAVWPQLGAAIEDAADNIVGFPGPSPCPARDPDDAAVFASDAKQSSGRVSQPSPGSPRHFAPRDDGNASRPEHAHEASGEDETNLDQVSNVLPFRSPLEPGRFPAGQRPDEGSGTLPALLESLAAAGARLWLAATVTYGPDQRARLAGRLAFAKATGVPLIATNDAFMHTPDRRPLSDVLTCIRTHTTLDGAGLRLARNAERHIKGPDEMARLFADLPDALAQTRTFLDGIGFSLAELAHDYPLELREGFATEQDALAAFARAGATRRYPAGVPEHIWQDLAKELAAVETMQYAAYFLTVHDIVRHARDQGILCQGRGSAANSVLCYCLGITEVDPTKHDLLFERFISDERNEPPDIDVDFEHERRESVMQYIYDHYGRLHAGLTASVVTYRTRSAIREVGKVFGLSEDTVGALSGTIWGYWSSGIDEGEARRIGLDPAEPRMAAVLALAEELSGFPRHLSQHTGGFVITRSRLDEVVPVAQASMKDRTTIEWDKDDLDAVRILKIDILALGMLSCMKRGFDLVERHYGRTLTIAGVPPEEACVYAMIQRADTLGVFQIESRAQMSMLPRLKPEKFYDLVIEVAIVRPGPIQGDMVHPYLRRRQKLEEVSYPSRELEQVLGKTLGVPLFQEQAMKIAIVAAGFAPSEADRLRRAMATFKRVGTIGTFRDKMVEGMVGRGYERDFAMRCFKQIEGFGTYGFPESHAASFALLVYTSCWLKCRYPDVFACALLNSQPMGFYAPAQIVRDAKDHGVEVRSVDINASTWDHALEPGGGESGAAALHPRHAGMRDAILGHHALRLGFRQVKGLRQADMERLVAVRGGGYDSVRDLWLRTGLGGPVLIHLAEADAFRSLGLDRRDALWAVRGLNRTGDKDDLPLLARAPQRAREADAALPPMRLGEHVVEDYRQMSLSLKAHPVSFLRAAFASRRMLRSEELATATSGRRVTVAGLVLVRQRPGSAHGVIFMTLEDETGVANIIVWPKVFEAQRAAVIASRLIAVTGRLQNQAGVVHVVAERIADLSAMLATLSDRSEELDGLARADEVRRPQTFYAQKRDQGIERALAIGFPLAADARNAAKRPSPDVARVMPKGRNFH